MLNVLFIMLNKNISFIYPVDLIIYIVNLLTLSNGREFYLSSKELLGNLEWKWAIPFYAPPLPSLSRTSVSKVHIVNNSSLINIGLEFLRIWILETEVFDGEGSQVEHRICLYIKNSGPTLKNKLQHLRGPV